MSAPPAQLALNLHLKQGISFSNYYAGPNTLAATSIQALAEAANGSLSFDQVYLWGGKSTGKSHLLQAACRAAAERGETCAYLPFEQLQPADTSLLEGLGDVALVCVDDLDAVIGHRVWDEALFHMINASMASGCRFALASRQNPGQFGAHFPDLISRLLAGPVFHLRPLDDNAKLAALTARAGSRGLELPEAAGGYLLNNCRRDFGFLLSLLDRLDKTSLAAQRRITVPFIKSVLEDV